MIIIWSSLFIFKYWFTRTFKVISEDKAVEMGLSFSHNIHGDSINHLNCRSIWKDKAGRDYRVETLFIEKNDLTKENVGNLPLFKEHICFEAGHNMFLVTEIDDGRSKIGFHKCSRCGHEEHFQYDYSEMCY